MSKRKQLVNRAGTGKSGERRVMRTLCVAAFLGLFSITILFGAPATLGKYVLKRAGSYTLASGAWVVSVAVSGTPAVGSQLNVQSIQPSAAQDWVDYQWESSAAPAGPFAPIAGAAASTFTLTSDQIGWYIRIAVTGKPGSVYAGTGAVSPALGPVTAPLASVAITGTPVVGSALSMSALSPASATAAYRWQRADTAGGVYLDIPGATATTYVLASGDLGKFVRLAADGTGSYTGTVFSAPAGPVVSGAAVTSVTISGNAVQGGTLTATVSPPGVPVTAYQWQYKTNSGVGSTWIDITGANGMAYTIMIPAGWQQIRVLVNGTIGSNIMTPSQTIQATTNLVSAPEPVSAFSLQPAGDPAYSWEPDDEETPVMDAGSVLASEPIEEAAAEPPVQLPVETAPEPTPAPTPSFTPEPTPLSTPEPMPELMLEPMTEPVTMRMNEPTLEPTAEPVPELAASAITAPAPKLIRAHASVYSKAHPWACC